MSDNINDKKLDLNKVEEAITEYSAEKTFTNIEEHPLFIKVIEKSIKEAAEGKTFTTDEVMKMTKEKYLFLK